VKKIFKKDCRKNKCNLNLNQESDTLKVQIKGYESINYNLTFKSKDGRCDYQELIVFCNECIEKHLIELLGMKMFDWKKIEENKYLSNYHFQTELNIERNDQSGKCLILRFYLIEKSRVDYKNYYKSL
jgi:hypothetical protein